MCYFSISHSHFNELLMNYCIYIYIYMYVYADVNIIFMKGKGNRLG